jgi:hypothetical protein
MFPEMTDPLHIPDNKRAGSYSSPMLKVLLGVGALLAILAVIFFPKVEYVDPKPALACGDAYFSKLEQRNVSDALELYTVNFRRDAGEHWEGLLTQLDAQNGGVTEFKTLGFHVVPVHLGEPTETGCILAQYQVSRNSLISEENLTICPHQHGAEWGIVGHEITRSDTGTHYRSGVTVQEITVHTP